jgi:8-oxo-dGTP diphosphatase
MWFYLFNDNCEGSMKEIQVVVGIILDNDHKVFLSKRKEGGHLGGFWEFPGGKVEPGESLMTALKRELKEEVDIDVDVDSCQLFSEERHVDSERDICLSFYLVKDFTGVAKGNEGQKAQWIELSKLNPKQMPPVNKGVIQKLKATISL